MKKILMIIGIVICLSTTGCGAYNLTNFVTPNDLEFTTLIASLDTPEKICDYMCKNFTYEAHPFYAPDPYTLWKTQKGDCNDMSTFAVFIAEQYGYDTYQIHIFYKGTIVSHYIAVYIKEGEVSFSDNWQYYPMQGDSFREIVDFDCWLQKRECSIYKVYNYEMKLIEKGVVR